MTLLWKKLAGLGLALLGGLMAAHGGAGGQVWEVLAGLALIVAGAVVLAGKIVRRNDPP
jgi:drug/metabolite transporter (DMT)-like permease